MLAASVEHSLQNVYALRAQAGITEVEPEPELFESIAQSAEVLTGWLMKRSGGKEVQKKKSLGQSVNKWDKRFFVLAPAPQGVAGQLSYYKRPDDWQKGAQPKGVIQLDGAQLLLSEEANSEDVTGKPKGKRESASTTFSVRAMQSAGVGNGGTNSAAVNILSSSGARVYAFRGEKEVAERFVARLRARVDKANVQTSEASACTGHQREMRYTYGFHLEPEQHAFYRKTYAGKVQKQRKVWYAFFRAQQARTVVRIAKHPELVMDVPPAELVRGGVPSDSRGHVWQWMSGSFAKRVSEENAGVYQAALSKASGVENETTWTIDKDLARTFPENQVLSADDKIFSLRNVLVAYSQHDPDIGYCQGMNYLVAMFLLFMDEEAAFWMLDTALHDILPANYYTAGMEGLRADQRVFVELVAEKLPTLYTHLVTLDVPIADVATPWFLCMFLTTLPIFTALRIWDCLWAEGSSTLLRVAVALLYMSQDALLKTHDFADAYILLQDTAKTHVDCEKLLAVAFDEKVLGSFPSAKLVKLRESGVAGVRREEAKFAAEAKERTRLAEAEEAAAKAESRVDDIHDT